MNDLEKKAAAITEEFLKIENSEERYKRIIEKGRQLQKVLEVEKLEKFLVAGCMSQAWLIPLLKDGKLYFHADSDALIVKGIIAILLEVVNGSLAKDVAKFDFAFLKDSHLIEQISMNRRNGLASLLKQIKLYATVLALS